MLNLSQYLQYLQTITFREENTSMGVKDAFTTEEWQTLLRLPFKIGVALMVVSPSGPIGAGLSAAV